MTAERNMSGTATTQNRICRDRMFCDMDAFGNGSRPCMVYHVEISARDKREVLNPPKPNREAAHNRNGRGTYSRAGVVSGDTAFRPKTTTATSTVPIASRAASPSRATLALRIQEIGLERQSTIGGTIVNSANAFV